jgi:putative aldouronate transport system substrate-binding protein
LISIAGGFRFDTTKVDASYAACLEVFQEFGLTLESGEFVPEEVPAAIKAYQESLDAAGYQEVLKEAQAQYEAWKTVR